MVDSGTTTVHIMPSFALYLIRVFEEMGIDRKKDTKLRVMLLGDEPVPLGEIGELVYTTPTREAMPLIRYRSGDLASFIPEPGACGRAYRRISRIQGRKDDMIVWKGVNIFPIQIDRVLIEAPCVEATYLVILETENDVDTMKIQVEVTEECLQGDAKNNEALRTGIVNALQSELLVRPKVELPPWAQFGYQKLKRQKRLSIEEHCKDHRLRGWSQKTGFLLEQQPTTERR
jgi:phenylacetate-coenzyme A ligase PaaK-like adenylate-forming protein